jgi:hypothetical protein
MSVLQFCCSALLLIPDMKQRMAVCGRCYYYWMVWYPIVYWLINVSTTIVGTIRGVKKETRSDGPFRSPVRLEAYEKNPIKIC